MLTLKYILKYYVILFTNFRFDLTWIDFADRISK